VFEARVRGDVTPGGRLLIDVGSARLLPTGRAVRDAASLGRPAGEEALHLAERPEGLDLEALLVPPADTAGNPAAVLAPLVAVVAGVIGLFVSWSL